MRGSYKEKGQILQERMCVRIHLYDCNKSVLATLDPVQEIKAHIRTLLLIVLTLVTDGAEWLVTRPCR